MALYQAYLKCKQEGVAATELPDRIVDDARRLIVKYGHDIMYGKITGGAAILAFATKPFSCIFQVSASANAMTNEEIEASAMVTEIALKVCRCLYICTHLNKHAYTYVRL